MSWTLRFDGLPKGPNDRLHWAKRAQFTEAWRTMALLKAQEAQIPPQEAIKVSAVIRRRRLGMADEDNDRARLKPLVDGLTDAGVVAKDTRKHVSWGTVTEERGEPGVTLIIEEVE